MSSKDLTIKSILDKLLNKKITNKKGRRATLIIKETDNKKEEKRKR